MKQVYLSIPKEVFDKIRAHLLRSDMEDAAFAYAKLNQNEDSCTFKFLDWDQLDDSNYESRSEYHLSLNDETRAYIIKKAHKLQASLVEFHSHSGELPVQFSTSDFYGFKEFVPHIWWRLNEKPYLALVFNKSSFDGLVWLHDPNTAKQLNGIIVDEQLLVPTKLSLKDHNNYE